MKKDPVLIALTVLVGGTGLWALGSMLAVLFNL